MPANRLVPLDWDPAAVELLARLAPSDIDRARIWWQTYAPTAYEAILDSKILELGESYATIDDLREAISRYLEELDSDSLDNTAQKEWYAAGLLFLFAGGAYWRMTGSIVNWRTIRTSIDTTLGRSQPDMQALCNGLRGGDVTLAAWQQQMTDAIKNAGIAAGIQAAGGVGNLDANTVAIIENNIREQLAYLDNFARAIGDGMTLDGTVCRLMKMYTQAARGLFHEVESYLMGQEGFDLEINVLGATENHCDGSGSCIEETAKGWQLRGSGTPIGSRTCLSNCNCHWQYRNSLTGEETRG